MDRASSVASSRFQRAGAPASGDSSSGLQPRQDDYREADDSGGVGMSSFRTRPLHRCCIAAGSLPQTFGGFRCCRTLPAVVRFV